MNRTMPCAFFALVSTMLLSSCSSHLDVGVSPEYAENRLSSPESTPNFSMRIPQHIETSERTVVVDPRVHVWGAYANGELVRAGQASAGSDYCHDLGRQCHTHVGSFRVFSLGSFDCKSHIFPIPKGGAPMPYCMYFNNGQALHGVPDSEVGEGNYSHGCVRMHVSDAEWLRFNFVNIGTRVIVRPYY